VRIVRIVSTGALTNGAKTPKRPNPSRSSDHGIEIATNQRGSDISRIAVPPSRRSGTSRTSLNVIANGMALATSLGLELDAETVLKLIHQGIDAQRSTTGR
jgi:hypothetical protein